MLTSRRWSQPAEHLRGALSRHWHLLTNDEDEVIGATLLARLSGEVGLEEIHDRYARGLAGPRLVPVWPLPDLPAPALLHAFRNRLYSRAVAISPDGSWLASGDDDGAVPLWNVATRALRSRIAAHSGPVTAVAISPDGSWLASAGRDGTVRLWNAADGSPRATLSGHRGEVSGVAIGPDGSWLASTGHDGTVRLWNASTGTVRAVWQLSQPPAFVRLIKDLLLAVGPEGGPLNGLAISPDGSWLASAGADQTVRLWNTADGSLRATLSGRHSSPVDAVAISPRWLLARVRWDRRDRVPVECRRIAAFR
jgi:WD40 repeat protein